MGMHKSIIKNYSGQSYAVKLPHESIPLQINIKAETFWNENSTQQFIRNLNVSNGYWQEIINQCHHLISTSYNNIEETISDLLIKQQIKVYPVKLLDPVDNPPEKRVIKCKDNITYCFEPVSTVDLYPVKRT